MGYLSDIRFGDNYWYKEIANLTNNVFFCSSLVSSNAFTTNQEHLKSSISVPIWEYKRVNFPQTNKQIMNRIF